MTLNAAIELIKKAKKAEANHFEKLRDEHDDCESMEDVVMEEQEAAGDKQESPTEIIDLLSPEDSESEKETEEDLKMKDVDIEEKQGDEAGREVKEQQNTEVLIKNEKKKQCPICDKVFTTATKCKYHIEAVHQKIKRFSCEHCEMKFYHIKQLRNHIINRHTFINDDTSNSNRPFKCEFAGCGKYYKTAEHLKKHQKFVHSGEKTQLLIELS
jgi:hypothetical protein